MAVSVAHAAIAALLALAVLVELICCAGILAMRTPLQRLHYLGPLAMVAPGLIGVAIALAHSVYAGAGLKAIFIALVLAAFGPVLSHQTGQLADARHDPP
jgi:multisubunit Na+/H+ antiporter MnhG subunit